MAQLKIREEANTPATPTEGIILYPTVATPSALKLVDDAGNNYTLPLLEKAQTWTQAQTFSFAPKVPGAINAETFSLDSSGSTMSLNAAQQLPISASGAFAGLVTIIEPGSGIGALYICAGSGIVKISESSGGVFTASDGVTANRIDVSFVASKYQIKNTFATTRILRIMTLRVRDAA